MVKFLISTVSSSNLSEKSLCISIKAFKNTHVLNTEDNEETPRVDNATFYPHVKPGEEVPDVKRYNEKVDEL